MVGFMFRKRPGPDVVVTEVKGRKWTYNVHPVVGAVKNRPLARFTVTSAWIARVRVDHGALRCLPSTPEVDVVATLPFHLAWHINATSEDGRPRFYRAKCDVRLCQAVPDGRVQFICFPIDVPEGPTLLHGNATPEILPYLLDCMAPPSDLSTYL